MTKTLAYYINYGRKKVYYSAVPSGLYYKRVMLVIYNRNVSGLYYKNIRIYF